MKIKSYSNINQSTTTRKEQYYKNLVYYYKEEPIKLNLHNSSGDQFIIFYNVIKKLEVNFNELSYESLKRRNTTLTEYLKSGYIVSEINSSLRAEGVNSSRKMVDLVIKSKINGVSLSKNKIQQLISNYYEAIFFILGKKEINKRNIFALYLILTAGQDNVVEDESFYRKGSVWVGEDKGMEAKLINQKVDELISFINSSDFENIIQTKAIIAHYVFENIHPYYDYNGRMGRLIHLWILINNSTDEFWKLTFLSESIYAYKNRFDLTFRKMAKAKKHNANIDLTYFVGNIYQIFIDHSKSYIKMKDMVNQMRVNPTRHLKLFIIDILNEKGNIGKWYDISEFKKRYSDYSSNVYSRVIKEIRESNLFDIRETKPIQFRFKKTMNW